MSRNENSEIFSQRSHIIRELSRILELEAGNPNRHVQILEVKAESQYGVQILAPLGTLTVQFCKYKKTSE